MNIHYRYCRDFDNMTEVSVKNKNGMILVMCRGIPLEILLIPHKLLKLWANSIYHFREIELFDHSRQKKIFLQNIARKRNRKDLSRFPSIHRREYVNMWKTQIHFRRDWFYKVNRKHMSQNQCQTSDAYASLHLWNQHIQEDKYEQYLIVWHSCVNRLLPQDYAKGIPHGPNNISFQ